MYFLLFGTIEIELWHHLRDWKVRKKQSITFRNRKTGAVSLIIYLSTIQKSTNVETCQHYIDVCYLSYIYLIFYEIWSSMYIFWCLSMTCVKMITWLEFLFHEYSVFLYFYISIGWPWPLRSHYFWFYSDYIKIKI